MIISILFIIQEAEGYFNCLLQELAFYDTHRKLLKHDGPDVLTVEALNGYCSLQSLMLYA